MGRIDADHTPSHVGQAKDNPTIPAAKLQYDIVSLQVTEDELYLGF
jgi:hypothetical protein